LSRSFIVATRPVCTSGRYGDRSTADEGGPEVPEIIVTTMNDLPGYQVEEVFGEVFGLTVRSRHIGSDIGASLKGLVGGEIKGYTKMLADSRLQAVERLREAAGDVGANAVIAMRFDCNEIGSNMTEVAAYGTAVTVRRA
jgi:uncharacterized protein YbjQ (UPF0145 family)